MIRSPPITTSGAFNTYDGPQDGRVNIYLTLIDIWHWNWFDTVIRKWKNVLSGKIKIYTKWKYNLLLWSFWQGQVWWMFSSRAGEQCMIKMFRQWIWKIIHNRLLEIFPQLDFLAWWYNTSTHSAINSQVNTQHAVMDVHPLEFLWWMCKQLWT